MAQQITIDIVAETQKLKQGIDQAGGQINQLDGKLKGLASAAAAAASAFILQKGVTFLKQGIDEAKEAAETMRAATTTFGEGSAALQKITEDAEKFGKAIAVDNDVIIQLSTQLGSRLPDAAKGLSAELVNLAFDIQAYTGGALSAETVTNKLAKAFADGEIRVAELEKIIPDLDAATYELVSTMVEAGDVQGALNTLIEAGQKKYGNAAESNVTASQKLDVALANLKETIGAKLLPTIEKIIDVIVVLIEKWDKQPELLKNIELAIIALIAIGGPLLTFFANAKTALVTLGIVQTATTGGIGAMTVATNLLSIAMRALPILAIIGLIVLLVQNWDTVTKVVGDVLKAIGEFAKDAVKWIKDAVKGIGEALKGIGGFFTKAVDTIVDVFGIIPNKMLEIGANIVRGLWNGISGLTNWIKDKVVGFFGSLIPGWAKDILGIKSPSKVFAGIGQNIVQGLVGGMSTPVRVPAVSTPARLATSSPINITINAGLGTDPYKLGREVNKAVSKYSRVSNKVVRR